MSDSSTSAVPPWSRMPAAISSSRSLRRAAGAPAAPCPARAAAVAAPMPLEAPVTSATVPSSTAMSASGLQGLDIGAQQGQVGGGEPVARGLGLVPVRVDQRWCADLVELLALGVGEAQVGGGQV